MVAAVVNGEVNKKFEDLGLAGSREELLQDIRETVDLGDVAVKPLFSLIFEDDYLGQSKNE